MIEINKVYCENCLSTMARMPDGFVDLTVTSPPYDPVDESLNVVESAGLREYSGYTWKFKDIARELYRITADGGVAVWVVGDRVVNGSETLTPMRQAIFLLDMGFAVHDTMIYQKDSSPFPEQTRYLQCWEYMFVLSKGTPRTTNIIKERTKGYKSSSTNTQRNSDGTVSPFKYEQGKSHRSLWNVWRIGAGYMKTTVDVFAFDHPAMFPEELVDRHVKTWSNPGDLVFDPFLGSGTTAKMAILNNRNFIGSEIAPEYTPIYEKRIADALAQMSKAPRIVESGNATYSIPPLFSTE